MKKLFPIPLMLLAMFGLLSCGGTEKESHTSMQPGMCAKEEMAADGIVRLSKIEVWPQYLDEYMKFATEVGEVSLRTEPGVLTMYAVAENEIHLPGNGRAGIHAADRLGRQPLAALLRSGGQSHLRSPAVAAHHHHARPYPLRFGLSLPARCRADSQPAKTEADAGFG